MRVIFPFLLPILTSFSAKQLEKLRQSCQYKSLDILTQNYVWTDPIRLRNPGLSDEDWQRVITIKCEEENAIFANVGNEWLKMFNDNPLKLNDWLQMLRVIRELLHVDESDEELKKYYMKLKEVPENVRKAIRWKSEDTSIDVKCVQNGDKSYSIELKARTRSLIKGHAWRCEDIGTVQNEIYEYYEIPSLWMLKIKDRFQYIRETACYSDDFCPEKALLEVNCTVSAIEHCSKTTVTKNSTDSSSFQRTLPAGLAIFGTFQSRVEHKENRNKTCSIGLKYGLYYLHNFHSSVCFAGLCGKVFCPPDAFLEAECSFNNLEKCERKVKKLYDSPNAHVRSLSDGIVLFGSFRKTGMVGNPVEYTIDPGLYFFSFKNSNTSCPEGFRFI
ncbi:unnamed protein product [Caenorhabditis sp. 36 PRJEB53466]|nr:unnamed protein product [Caenorhabditis sp. 36 PRJEB53466]